MFWIILLLRNHSCNEKVTVNNICFYGDDILAHVKQTLNQELRHVKNDYITLVDKSNIKRKGITTQRYGDVKIDNMNKKIKSPDKTENNNISDQKDINVSKKSC